MKKLLFIVSALVLSVTMSAQSLSTGIQYIGAAASHNATKRQQASARGENAPLKVKFQMNIDVSGRLRWGYIPSQSYQAYSTTGGNVLSGGPAVNLDLGIRFSDSYFVGIGGQFNATFYKTYVRNSQGEDYAVRVTDMYVPIYGVFKVYIPSSNGVSPYFDLGIGGYLPDWYEARSSFFEDHKGLPSADDVTIEGNKLSAKAKKGGFYLHGAVGTDINRFNLAAGYELTTAEEKNHDTRFYHNLYFKIGFRIGG